jgi:hypothetical protein
MTIDDFEGMDIDLDISLNEYGLLISKQPVDESKTNHIVIYQVIDDLFDTAHFSHRSANSYVLGNEFPNNKEIDNFLKFVDSTKTSWINNSLISKVYDLISYWGYMNIFGDSKKPRSIDYILNILKNV